MIVGLTGAFGGGAEVDADPADGRLDVVAIEARLARRASSLHGYGLRSGRVEEQHGRRHRDAGARIEVETDGDAPASTSTASWSTERRLVFTVEPRAFEVVVGR